MNDLAQRAQELATRGIQYCAETTDRARRHIGHAADATGRYVPSWSRGSDGTLHNEPLVDYEKPGVGDFYLLANQC